MRFSRRGPDLSFVYFCDADDEGHVYGPHTPEYPAAMGRVDNHLARIRSAIRHRVEALGEDWFMVLTTDHGHRDEGGHGGDSQVERTAFVAATRFGGSLAGWPAKLTPSQLAPLLLSSPSD